MAVLDVPAAKGLEFHYLDVEQGSPEWLAAKRGRIGSSKLEDWLATSVAKGKEGTPLKARLDYEKQLMFERQFNTNFETYVNSAMQDGLDFEDWARRQYELITGATCEKVGCWYNEFFAASPDRTVKRGDSVGKGLLEIKILKDNSFTDVLINGVPRKYWRQIQGQLWATGYDWCDFVAVNFNTKKVVILRVMPDPEFHAYLAESVQETLVVDKFMEQDVFDIVGDIPQGLVLPGGDSIYNNNEGDW